MNLIVLHRNNKEQNKAEDSLLRFAWTCNPLTDLIMDGFGKYAFDSYEAVYAVPQEWSDSYDDKNNIVTYNKNIRIASRFVGKSGIKIGDKKWFVVSNGRYFTKINDSLLHRIFDNVKADVVLINAEPGLLGEREKIRLTDNGSIAGFRRLYADSVKRCPVPEDWPAYLFVKSEKFNNLLTDNSLSLSFSDVIEKCKSSSLEVCAVNAGGIMLDIGKEDSLLQFSKFLLSQKNDSEFHISKNDSIASDSRLEGKVLLGQNVRIGSKAVIVGPAVICDNTVIEENSLIYSSIIGSDTVIKSNQSVHSRIVNRQYEKVPAAKKNYTIKSNIMSPLRSSENCFRKWPRFSYAGFLKRIVDIILALVVLILFIPLFPFIALAIKLTSPGPIFYGHKRQSLYGKEFHCIKFRTMITGANEIQQKLRHISQVDGPQFKMEDDPRINYVGKFLRETYLDEIPQFINVLMGQMSIVGPRPSPESENTLCPFWRDARLSVRPGITGLWQIYRTREPLKDFQEWIYYDTEYVKNLSLKMDIEICWKTAKKMIDMFISQF